MIAIKDLYMPKDGEMHHINIYDNGSVYVTTIGRIYEIEMKDLKAVETVTPHGRLIDADKLRAILRGWTEDEWNQKSSPRSWAYAYEDLINLIDDAPTIIEAEN